MSKMGKFFLMMIMKLRKDAMHFLLDFQQCIEELVAKDPRVDLLKAREGLKTLFIAIWPTEPGCTHPEIKNCGDCELSGAKENKPAKCNTQRFMIEALEHHFMQSEQDLKVNNQQLMKQGIRVTEDKEFAVKWPKTAESGQPTIYGPDGKPSETVVFDEAQFTKMFGDGPKPSLETPYDPVAHAEKQKTCDGNCGDCEFGEIAAAQSMARMMAATEPRPIEGELPDFVKALLEAIGKPNAEVVIMPPEDNAALECDILDDIDNDTDEPEADN